MAERRAVEKYVLLLKIVAVISKLSALYCALPVNI